MVYPVNAGYSAMGGLSRVSRISGPRDKGAFTPAVTRTRFGSTASEHTDLEILLRNAVGQTQDNKSGTVNTVFPVPGDGNHLFRADTDMLGEMRKPAQSFSLAQAAPAIYPDVLSGIENFGQPVRILGIEVIGSKGRRKKPQVVATGDVAMVKRAPGKPIGGTFSEMKAAIDREKLDPAKDLLEQLDPLARDVLEMQYLSSGVYTELFTTLMRLSQYFSLDPYPNNTMRDGHVLTPIDVVQPSGRDTSATPRRYGTYTLPDKPIRTLQQAAQYLADEVVPITLMQFKPRIIDALNKLKALYQEAPLPRVRALFNNVRTAYGRVEEGYKEGFEAIGLDPDPFRFIATDGMPLPQWEDNPQAS